MGNSINRNRISVESPRCFAIPIAMSELKQNSLAHLKVFARLERKKINSGDVEANWGTVSTFSVIIFYANNNDVITLFGRAFFVFFCCLKIHTPIFPLILSMAGEMPKCAAAAGGVLPARLYRLFIMWSNRAKDFFFHFSNSLLDRDVTL